MNPLKRLRLLYRAAKRLGAFKRASRAGLSVSGARSYSDNLYPPTPDDLAYEESLRRKDLKGSN